MWEKHLKIYHPDYLLSNVDLQVLYTAQPISPFIQRVLASFTYSGHNASMSEHPE